MNYHYDTLFDDSMNPYYVISIGKKRLHKVGVIPAGISFTHRKKEYSTSQLLSCMFKAWQNNQLADVKDILSPYKNSHSWLHGTGTFKKDFADICNALQKITNV